MTLKRSPMPPRTVPLVSSAPLARSAGSGRHPRLALVEGNGAPVVPIRSWSRRGPSNTIPRDVRLIVLVRDGYSCACCGTSVIGQRYSLGHRKRASQGGRATPENLLTFLGWGGEACHGRIDSRRDPADEAKGYTVRSWQDPGLIPVMIFSEHGSGVTVWLLPDGRYSYESPEGEIS